MGSPILFPPERTADIRMNKQPFWPTIWSQCDRLITSKTTKKRAMWDGQFIIYIQLELKTLKHDIFSMKNNAGIQGVGAAAHWSMTPYCFEWSGRTMSIRERIRTPALLGCLHFLCMHRKANPCNERHRAGKWTQCRIKFQTMALPPDPQAHTALNVQVGASRSGW